MPKFEQLDGRIGFMDGFCVQLPEGEFEPAEDVLEVFQRIAGKKSPQERGPVLSFARAQYTGSVMWRERDFTVLRKSMQKQMVNKFRVWRTNSL